jgi:P4 family phage/plasmid primase-like protien
LNQTFNIYIGGGQNGKSVLTDLMSQVLGNYKVAVPVALIRQQRGKIGGLAPEIVAMKGTRYAVMQEPSKGDRINEGILKELVSGVEPIKARAPYMLEPIEFIPQFKLVMCSNELPEIKTQDHGTWRRIRVDPFESLLTEKPVLDDPEKPYQFLLDRNIKERFEDWRQVFAAMLIEVVTKTQGKVEDCDIVLSASKDYRARQDYLSEFVSDKITRDPKGMVRKSQLTDEFKLWFATNNGGKANPKDMHEYMDKTFGKQRNGMWHGIRIKFREDEYEDCGSMATTNDVESDTEILNDL